MRPSQMWWSKRFNCSTVPRCFPPPSSTLSCPSEASTAFLPLKAFHSNYSSNLPTDKNLPNSSSVEVEVTPPMNGTAGQEGETVRRIQTQHTNTEDAAVPPLAGELGRVMKRRRSWVTDIKVRETFMNILWLSSVSVFHLERDWCKGCTDYGTGHYCW